MHRRTCPNISRSPLEAPLTTYGPQFLLYYWTVCVTGTHDNDNLRHVKMIMVEDLRRVGAFVERCIESSEEVFVSQLLARLTTLLHDKTLSYGDAYTAHYVLTAFVYIDPDAFACVDMPEGLGLIPTLIVGWQRQLCHAPDEIIRDFYVTLKDMW